MFKTAFVLSLALAIPGVLVAQQTPIRITADLSEAPRKLYHAEVEIPVQPGPLTLTTPKWIPGNHRPTGPIGDITGVVFTANGHQIPWRRDNVEMYQYHLTVPPGVTTLHAHLDCIATSRVTQKWAVLEWEKLLLYPADKPVKDIPIIPSVTVPEGWGIGTALTPTGSDTKPVPETGIDEADHTSTPGAVTTHYAATTVEQLEDSPVITGQYFREFALAPEVSPKHYIDVVADQAEDANLRPQLIAELGNLVREATAAYASHHYHVYHFLLTLSDATDGEGLEHGQSSDNGTDEKIFTTQDKQLVDSDLLSHEFTHSWNGKYRRPARLYQPTFETPEQTDLLWVYEGLTQYMGNVLAARSGLKSQSEYRDILASSAADLDYKPGREWRSTEDTAIAASVLRHLDSAWSNWRRGQDYYGEGELLWLDADTLIRQRTNNKKSLTDFLHIFLGKGGNTGPLIVPYELPEVIADLNEVTPYDWAKFLHDRVDNINPRADLDGITRGGYKLVFTDKPNQAAKIVRENSTHHPGPNVWYSLGLRVSNSGAISDVRWGGPADNAKLHPGQKIIAVDGVIFSSDSLKSAIDKAKGSKEPLHLILQSDDFVTLANIDYHEGQRYPALVRVPGTPDYLDDITAPLTRPDPASLNPPAQKN